MEFEIKLVGKPETEYKYTAKESTFIRDSVADLNSEVERLQKQKAESDNPGERNKLGIAIRKAKGALARELEKLEDCPPSPIDPGLGLVKILGRFSDKIEEFQRYLDDFVANCKRERGEFTYILVCKGEKLIRLEWEAGEARDILEKWNNIVLANFKATALEKLFLLRGLLADRFTNNAERVLFDAGDGSYTSDGIQNEVDSIQGKALAKSVSSGIGMRYDLGLVDYYIEAGKTWQALQD